MATLGTPPQDGGNKLHDASPMRNVVGSTDAEEERKTPPSGPPLTRIDSIVRDINKQAQDTAKTPLLGDHREFSEKYLGIGVDGHSTGRTTPVRALTPDEMYNGGEDKLDSPPWSNPSSPKFGAGRRGEASLKTCVFNLVSTIVGGGALSLPFAMACTGLGVGMVELAAVGVMSAYSLHLLVSCARRSGGESYVDVARRCYGDKMQVVCSALILTLTFLSTIAYLILLNQMLTPLLPAKGLLDPKHKAHSWLVMGLCAGAIFPVTLFRSLKALRFTSYLAVFSIFFLAIAVAVRAPGVGKTVLGPDGFAITDVKHSAEDGKAYKAVFAMWPAEGRFFLSFPILSCAFLCHFNVLPLHVELTRPTRKRMKIVIYTTMLTCFFIYAVVAVLGYLAFRETLLDAGADGGNIIAMFDRVLHKDWLLDVGRCGLCATLICTIPLLTHPARDSLMELLQQTRLYRDAPAEAEWIKDTLLGRFLYSATHLVAALVLAVAVGNVVVIWSFAGATTAILISFTLPSMFYLKLRKGPMRKDRHKQRAAALLAVSVVLLVICSVEAVLNVIHGTGKKSRTGG